MLVTSQMRKLVVSLHFRGESNIETEMRKSTAVPEDGKLNSRET